MTSSWPGESATVARWVRGALVHMSTDGKVAISGLDRVKVSADLTGTDLNQLTLDATSVKLRVDVNDTHAASQAHPGDTEREPALPAPTLRETGVAREFRVVATPMRIQRTPVTLDLRLYDIPIVWLTFAEPTEAGVPDSIHSLTPDENLESVRGNFHASIRTTEVASLISSVARPLLKEGGVRLGRLRLDFAEDGGHSIRVTASAGLRWKLLMASARAEAQIHYTPDAVITIRTLTVGSRNPLVKFALLFVRKHLRTAIGQSADVNAQLAEDGIAMRIHDLRIQARDQLTLSARFS